MPAHPLSLETINWQKVYQATRSQVQWRSWFGLSVWAVALLVAGVLLFQEFSPNRIMLVIMMAGPLVYGVLAARQQGKIHLLVLEAQFLKNEMQRRRYGFILDVHKAFSISPAGHTQPQPDWEGFKVVWSSMPLQRAVAEKDFVRLLCLPSGEVLGNLEQYL